MKLTRFTTIALLALSSLTFVPTTAQAVTYADGDLLLGFKSTNASVTSTLLVNIGNAGTYKGTAGTADVTIANVVGSLNTDLIAAFGSGWATDPDVYWGIAGTTNNSAFAVSGDAASTMYATKAETVYGTPETGYAKLSGSGYATGKTRMTNAGGVLNNLSSIGATQGANANAILEPDTGNSASWAFLNTGTAGAGTGTSYGLYTSPSNIGNNATGITTVGGSGVALDLFRMIPTAGGTGSYEGTFTIAPTGIVSFGAAPSAVPEPGLALLQMAGLTSVAFRRRRAATRA